MLIIDDILTILTLNLQALVRNADPEIVEMLPRSVQIAVGDVGEPSTLKNAVEGCNKIIFCARARSNITGDLNRVDRLGVYNIAKAFQVFAYTFNIFCAWKLTHSPASKCTTRISNSSELGQRVVHGDAL